jgi:hypothetical protein
MTGEAQVARERERVSDDGDDDDRDHEAQVAREEGSVLSGDGWGGPSCECSQ